MSSLLTFTDIGLADFSNCSNYEPSKDDEYVDCIQYLDNDTNVCDNLKDLHSFSTYSYYSFGLVQLILSIFAFVINVIFIYVCVITIKDKRSSLRKTYVLNLNRAVGSIIGLFLYYSVFIVWKSGSLEKIPLVIIFIISTLSFTLQALSCLWFTRILELNTFFGGLVFVFQHFFDIITEAILQGGIGFLGIVLFISYLSLVVANIRMLLFIRRKSENNGNVRHINTKNKVYVYRIIYTIANCILTKFSLIVLSGFFFFTFSDVGILQTSEYEYPCRKFIYANTFLKIFIFGGIILFLVILGMITDPLISFLCDYQTIKPFLLDNINLCNPSNCYRFVDDKKNWQEAEEYCKELGGHLTNIQDEKENEFLSSFANKTFLESSEFWIGANNYDILCTWSWIDESAFNYTEWDMDKFDNTSDKRWCREECAAGIADTQKWMTRNCTEIKPFVCLQTLGFDWIYSSMTGYEYKVYKKPTQWENAEQICVSENSNLVSIHSKEELDFVIDLVTPYSKNSCKFEDQTWSGMFSPDDTNKKWLWSDSSPVDFLNWASTEPDNPGFQNCVNIWTGASCPTNDVLSRSFFFSHSCKVDMDTGLPVAMDNFVCKRLLNHSALDNSKFNFNNGLWIIGAIILFIIICIILTIVFKKVFSWKKIAMIRNELKNRGTLSFVTTTKSDRYWKHFFDNKNLIIDFNSILGKGSNSVVYRAVIQKTNFVIQKGSNQLYNSNLAVKIPRKYETAEMEEFHQQLDALLLLKSHPHIISLVGWSLYGDIPILITELAETTLLNYVQTFPSHTNPLKPNLQFLWQISSALEYIAEKRIIHRDVACRNVLMMNNNIAKLADFGLCCCCDDTGTFKDSVNKRFPLKWLSPEALTNSIFSEKSDVWAFGVFCWEVFSYGCVPYSTTPNSDLIELLKTSRLEQPKEAPDYVYKLMMRCWDNEPSRRPKFIEIKKEIRIMLEKETIKYGYLYLKHT